MVKLSAIVAIASLAWHTSVRFGFSAFALACAMMLGWGISARRAGRKSAE